jgi:hypothetical protein
MNREKGNALFNPDPAACKGSAATDLTQDEKAALQFKRLDETMKKHNRVVLLRWIIVAFIVAFVGAGQYAVLIYSKWVAMVYTAAGFVLFVGAGVILVVAALSYAMSKWR